MKLIEDIGFDSSFSFIFSARPGTPAPTLHDDTPQDVKLQRLQHLQAAPSSRTRGASAPARVGTVQRILVEGLHVAQGSKPGSGSTELMGRTECNRIVNFDGGPRVRWSGR